MISYETTHLYREGGMNVPLSQVNVLIMLSVIRLWSTKLFNRSGLKFWRYLLDGYFRASRLL